MFMKKYLIFIRFKCFNIGVCSLPLGMVQTGNRCIPAIIAKTILFSLADSFFENYLRSQRLQTALHLS